MTVLVTTSRICRTVVREDLCLVRSAKRALRAASQSKTGRTEWALKGDLTVQALRGGSRLEMAGLGGSLRLGNEAAPMGGADMGTRGVHGVGETTAEAAVEGFSLPAVAEMSEGDEGSEESSSALDEASDSAAADEADVGVSRPSHGGAGEPRDMARVRKSV